MSPAQKKALETQLVGEGLVRGGGVAQYGGFIGMLASLGVPLAISLVKNYLLRECKPNSLLLDSAVLLALHPLVEKECKYNFLHLSLVHGVISKKRNI